MNWETIRLELSGTRDFPAGSVSRGYLIRVPLNDDGAIDETTFASSPQRATVRRFWSTEPDESGRLVRLNGSWALRCNGKPDRLLAIQSPALAVGEEVAVVGPDGARLPFRVASIGRSG